MWTSLGTGRLAAQNNGGPPEDASDHEIFPAGQFCVFGIDYQTVGKGKTITLPGDRTIFTSPGLHVTLTNLSDTSKQVTFNITGAFHQTIESNHNVVTVVTGRNLLGDPVQGLVLAIGHFSYIFDATGHLIQSLQGKGQLVPVCTLLE
jgi:hypothetical protein